VWAHLVVIDPPAFDGFPRIVQSEKPVLVDWCHFYRHQPMAVQFIRELLSMNTVIIDE
jgi:hypothetical protein